MQGWVQTHVLSIETEERPQIYGVKQVRYHRPCLTMGKLWASFGLCEPADDPVTWSGEENECFGTIPGGEAWESP